MLAALSASIADINTNILGLEATTSEDTHARIDVTVEIKDMKHLEKVIKSLRSVDGVLDIERALFGSGNEYFDRLNQITTLTQQAIDRATVASSVADPLSFTGNTSNVVPITNGLSAIERQLNTTNDLLVAIANQNLNVSVGNSGGQAATVSVNRKGF